MFWEAYRLGKTYSRVRHKDCGAIMSMPRSYYPTGAWWACECGWSAPQDYLAKKDAQWYADHFEGWITIHGEGRLVWLSKNGERYTAQLPELYLNGDGTVSGGGTWEPF